MTITSEMKPRIMIVDDNVELLEELRCMLELGGYEVIALSDGSQALDVACQEKPNLILLDLKMSPKSGFQIAEELKETSLKDIPIVAMTGFFTDREHRLMMELCGIKRAILKPFMPVNLISQIEFALSG